MKSIHISSLNKILKGDDRIQLTAKWLDTNENGEQVESEGQFFLLQNISFAAQLRLAESRDLVERTVRLLVERVRFGDDGESALTYETALEAVEGNSPVLLAVHNAAWNFLLEKQKEAEARAKKSIDGVAGSAGEDIAAGNAKAH